MKIVICDYKTDLGRDLDYEIRQLKEALPESEIVVYEYQDDKQDLIRVLQGADAVINTYVDFDREVLSLCKHLKCIALNAVGYNMVDVETATELGIMVCPAAEYCTIEVAEHTFALILALSRGIRKYIQDIEHQIWDYMGAGRIERLSGKTMAIFGFGKIGQAVAARAKAFGLKVLVVSQSLTKEKAAELDLKLVDWCFAMENSDIVSNHMALKPENTDFFNLERFALCKRKPLFINTGRGGSVVEDDLVKALDIGYLSGAGLDVLKNENVDFSKLALLGRDNVIITPHTGFYSIQSARDLQDISCETVIGALTENYGRISKVINAKALNLPSF
jgi:D-3-phosphoglycerate dehydrogenase